MGTSIINRADAEYKFKIKDFEGPLDLLLYLICKNKMNIFDINLNSLTDEYIKYLEDMNTFNMDIASEFIVMASTLLNIKSKKLLPELEEKQEDEEQISEEEMIARIIDYKKYKEVSNKIKSMYLSNFGSFMKPYENIKFEKNIEYEGDKFSKYELNEIYVNILNKNINKINKNSDQVKKLALYEKITVKQKAEQIMSYLKNNNQFIFSEMFNYNEVSNMEIVTGFLSTLELNKMNEILIKQDSSFSPINIYKNN